ncbi:MAG: iron complex transport system substrate-binding protein, partial [Pseudonocardiales bacterium]|nr:iron complex transport system substrate-binding protein [Pseudonocardiales bacterium]
VSAPLNFEQIAAVAPDRVLNVQSSGDASEYHTLSQLAPPIGLPPDTAPNTVSWRDSARIIARAVGRPGDGDSLVVDTETTLAKARAANPKLAGHTVSVLLGAGEQLGVYTVRDTRMQVLTALGLRPTAYLTGLDPAKFYVTLSPELIADADADVVVLLTREGLSEAAALTRYPVLAPLRDGPRPRLVVVVEDDNIALALSNASVLSIPYAVAGLLPLLTARLG